MGSDVMNEMDFFEKALKELNVSKFVYRGSFPENEEQFNNSFKKIIGENLEQIAIESSNPDDFGVTWEQVNAKIQELEAAEPMRLLREERNRRLTETDWKDLPSYPGTDQEEWRTYRQSLRDLPSTASPQLDDNGQLTNVTWPTKPE